MILFCMKEERHTEHTKKNDMRYYCNECGFTNGIKYSSLGCDSR
jgi:ribosomal protein L44E